MQFGKNSSWPLSIIKSECEQLQLKGQCLSKLQNRFQFFSGLILAVSMRPDFFFYKKKRVLINSLSLFLNRAIKINVFITRGSKIRSFFVLQFWIYFNFGFISNGCLS